MKTIQGPQLLMLLWVFLCVSMVAKVSEYLTIVVTVLIMRSPSYHFRCLNSCMQEEANKMVIQCTSVVLSMASWSGIQTTEVDSLPVPFFCWCSIPFDIIMVSLLTTGTDLSIFSTYAQPWALLSIALIFLCPSHRLKSPAQSHPAHRLKRF